jgi:hypothetical protein
MLIVGVLVTLLIPDFPCNELLAGILIGLSHAN